MLALIAMVAGTIGKTVFDGWRRGQVKTCRIQVRTVAGDVLQYMIDNDNQCPESLESLPKAGFGREAPRDPWGNALQLRCPGEEEKIEVFSGGLDEEVGTSDDIKSWQD